MDEQEPLKQRYFKVISIEASELHILQMQTNFLYQF